MSFPNESSMSWSRRSAAGLTLFLLLSAGCGFEPLYRESGSARRLKDAVIVEAVGDDLGYEVETALAKRLGSPYAPRYVLNVRTKVDESEMAAGGLGGFQRFNLNGSGQFEIKAIGGERLLYQGSVEGSAAYTSTRETFHSLTARRDARLRLAAQLAERIARRLESTAESWLE